MSKAITILFVGDIVGGIGRRTLLSLLPSLRERFEPSFVVVNGENAAGGIGITPKNADELFACRHRRDHAGKSHISPPRHLPVSG